MKTIKIISGLLLIGIVLSGCASGTAAPSETTAETTDTESETPAVSETAAESEAPAVSDTGNPAETESQMETETAAPAADYTGLVKDAFTYVNESVFQEFHVPEIELEHEDVKQINAEIMADYYDGHIKEEIQKDSTLSVVTDWVSYTWSVHEDILSLCVHAHCVWNLDAYSVYNVSASTGKRIPDSKVLAYAGLDEAAYMDMARKGLEKAFVTRYPEELKESSNPEIRSFYDECLAETLTDDNVALSKPYLNENGQLCCTGKIYSLAGPSSHNDIINLEEMTVIQDPGLEEMLLRESALSDYIFPDSSERYLRSEEITPLSAVEKMYARNEIYARHGRKFNDSELDNYFRSKSWYSPTIAPEDFSDDMLNEYEKANIALISSYE